MALPSQRFCNFVALARCRNAAGVAENAEEIAKLKKMAKELEQKSINEESRVSEQGVTIENLHMNFSLFQRTTGDTLEDCKFT